MYPNRFTEIKRNILKRIYWLKGFIEDDRFKTPRTLILNQTKKLLNLTAIKMTKYLKRFIGNQDYIHYGTDHE